MGPNPQGNPKVAVRVFCLAAREETHMAELTLASVSKQLDHMNEALTG